MKCQISTLNLKIPKFRRDALIKCQIFVLNLNMSKTKWDGAEEPTINNFFKIDSRKFRICSLKCRTTEANRSISYQPKYAETLLGDKCPLTWLTHCKTQNIRSIIISLSREKNGFIFVQFHSGLYILYQRISRIKLILH